MTAGAVQRSDDWAMADGGADRAVNGRTLVVGLGATGLAAAKYLSARGGDVVVIDSREAPPGLEALRGASPGVRIVLETLDPRWLEGADRVVLSPGVSHGIELVREARRRGLPVVSDIELFARAAEAPVLAVTGSNGKSTVATLTARLLEAQGLAAPAGGNLGPPALELLDAPRADAYVLEISSFQMEATESLRPRAAAVLNVSADHLDRHGSLERYAALKRKLLEHAELAVFNLDDPLVRAMGEAHANAVAFSTRETLARGWCVVEHRGRAWLAHAREPLAAVDELGLRGAHNVANALAALALADALGGERAAALEALKRFTGLPHRYERVAERRGVTYIDDSKATNVGAAVAALSGAPDGVVLIAGGLSKGADFAALAEACRGRVGAAVLIGEAAPALERALEGACPTLRAATLPEAVAAAARLARPGGTVLLSPACASQDMFADYRERGEAFAAAVRELPR